MLCWSRQQREGWRAVAGARSRYSKFLEAGKYQQSGQMRANAVIRASRRFAGGSGRACRPARRSDTLSLLARCIELLLVPPD